MKIGTVIVAAGLSSRMKDFKPLLPIGDKVMIELTINNFQFAGIDEIVVVTGYRNDDIIKKLSNYNVNFVYNKNYRTNHMFDSVCMGLNEIKSNVDFAFISPSDSPFVQQFTLKTMIQEINNNDRNNINLIQPSYERKKGHPLLLNKNGIEQVLRHDGKMGLRGAISLMNKNVLNKPFADPGILLDADTPNDYMNLLEFNKYTSCPSTEICVKIQNYFDMPDSLKSHSSKMAEIAVKIYEDLLVKGIKLDINIIVAASLLHDIGKDYCNHAEVGSQWLKDMGYYYVSEIVKEHEILNSIPKIPSEKEVVYLADKLVQDEFLIEIKEKLNIMKKTFKYDKTANFVADHRKNQALEIYQLIYNNKYFEE